MENQLLINFQIQIKSNNFLYQIPQDMMNDEKYEVVIIGGGLAGLTLALQLKQSRPSISMLVLEKRRENAPVATHKVGESLSEMGAFYLREILKLKDYLSKHQLRKFGFRFFFSPEQADNIERRVEVGSKIFNPFPTHQIDRGLLENELVQKLKDAGVQILLGAKVTEVELSKKGNTIFFELEQESSGTRRLIILLGEIYLALDSGTPIVIDELDASLHTRAADAILALFASPETNPKGAQLIATTHNTNLLTSKFLRRDQVWFTEKSHLGATSLYSLSDTKWRKGDDIEKGYLQGRFGALPFAGSAAEIVKAG